MKERRPGMASPNVTRASDVCAWSKVAAQNLLRLHIQMDQGQVRDKGWFTVEDIARIPRWHAVYELCVLSFFLLSEGRIYMRFLLPTRRWLPVSATWKSVSFFFYFNENKQGGRCWRMRSCFLTLTPKLPPSPLPEFFHLCTAVQLGEK